jgi:hypothetical protein
MTAVPGRTNGVASALVVKPFDGRARTANAVNRRYSLMVFPFFWKNSSQWSITASASCFEPR